MNTNTAGWFESVKKKKSNTYQADLKVLKIIQYQYQAGRNCQK
jgi:hypothetical protein